MKSNLDISAMTRSELEAELQQVNARLEASMKVLMTQMSAAFKDSSNANVKAMNQAKSEMSADERRMRALMKALKPHLSKDKKPRAARKAQTI